MHDLLWIHIRYPMFVGVYSLMDLMGRQGVERAKSVDWSGRAEAHQKHQKHKKCMDKCLKMRVSSGVPFYSQDENLGTCHANRWISYGWSLGAPLWISESWWSCDQHSCWRIAQLREGHEVNCIAKLSKIFGLNQWDGASEVGKTKVFVWSTLKDLKGVQYRAPKKVKHSWAKPWYNDTYRMLQAF